MNIYEFFGVFMRKFITLIFLLTVLASCQSKRSWFNLSGSRKIANTRVLKMFIDDIARQSQKTGQRYTTQEIEKKVLEYLKRKEKDMAHGNWTKVGISKLQVDDMKSLYDDVPHMNKVHKWVAENITKIIKVSDDLAAISYNTIVRRNTANINPYSFGKQQSNQLMLNRRTNTSPFRSVNEKGARVFKQVSEVKDNAIKKVYMENYLGFQKRASNSPALTSNAHEILESATQVTKYTGKAGMGSGCKSFNEKASFEVLEMKANIDIYRANLIQERAITKNGGRAFASVDDIPSANRLTAKEIDEATEEAFENVLGYTKVEARAAVKRLKGKPCKVY